MGVCNVLAVLPFLCAGEPAPQEQEEPNPEMHNIPAQPSPEVEVGTLDEAPTVRAVSDYEVLPPSSAPQAEVAETAEDAHSFDEWVNQNWGDNPAPASASTPQLRANEPRVAQAEPEIAAVPETTSEPAPRVIHIATPTSRARDRAETVAVTPPSGAEQTTIADAPDLPPSEPRQELVPARQPVIAMEPVVDDADTAPAQVAMNTAAVRPSPGPAPAASPSKGTAVVSASWTPEMAVAAGTIRFAEPVEFNQPGAQVAADGVAARKRIQERRMERELRREARRRNRN